MSETLSVNEVLARFLVEAGRRPLPSGVAHEARRALLNVLGASAGAVVDPAVAILRSQTTVPTARASRARVLWTQERRAPVAAALVNAAMMHVLDFDDTHRPTFCHAAPAVAAAVLAEGEALQASGADLERALALGIEVQLALATLLFPSHYLRGFHISATTAGVGAAAGCAVLRRLEVGAATHALGLAMTASGGLIETLGTMANAYGVGNGARIGVEAASLAAAGYESAPTLFDGDKGMLRAASDEAPDRIPAVLDELGERWRILEASYKRFPTETITQAPLEAVLNVRARVDPARRERLTGISMLAKPIVADVVEQRRRKFGPRPRTQLEAKFDIRYCMAAAWVAGEWSGTQLSAEAIADPRVAAVRDVISAETRPDWLGNQVRCEFRFGDGSVETEHIEAFLGSADNPMSDDDLEAKLRGAAGPGWPPARAARAIAAIWELDRVPTVRALVDLLAFRDDRRTSAA